MTNRQNPNEDPSKRQEKITGLGRGQQVNRGYYRAPVRTEPIKAPDQQFKRAGVLTDWVQLPDGRWVKRSHLQPPPRAPAAPPPPPPRAYREQPALPPSPPSTRAIPAPAAEEEEEEEWPEPYDPSEELPESPDEELDYSSEEFDDLLRQRPFPQPVAPPPPPRLAFPQPPPIRTQPAPPPPPPPPQPRPYRSVPQPAPPLPPPPPSYRSAPRPSVRLQQCRDVEDRSTVGLGRGKSIDKGCYRAPVRTEPIRRPEQQFKGQAKDKLSDWVQVGPRKWKRRSELAAHQQPQVQQETEEPEEEDEPGEGTDESFEWPAPPSIPTNEAAAQPSRSLILSVDELQTQQGFRAAVERLLRLSPSSRWKAIETVPRQYQLLLLEEIRRLREERRLQRG